MTLQTRGPVVHILTIALFCFIGLTLGAQTIDFTFDTKDYDGNVLPFNERLDPERNYLVLFSAFWCLPCVKQIDDKLSKNIRLYRDQYNLEIILLNDDYYDDPHIALDKIRDKQWYFDQYMTDGIFSSLGVSSIPRDYFIPAGESTGKRVYANSFLRDIEDYHIENGYTSVFFHKQSQVIASENCKDLQKVEYGLSESAAYNDTTYHLAGAQYYRSGILNKNIYRYDPLIGGEVIVFDYYLNQCDEFDLVDHEGDRMTISVEDRIVTDGGITLITDMPLSGACSEGIPLILSSEYGSNAGLIFDIENGEIVSHLVCHSKDGESVYTSPQLGDLCESLGSTDLVDLSGLSLSNNPGNGRFEVLGNPTDLKITTEIFAADGATITDWRPSGESRIDISYATSGIYTIVIWIDGTRNTLTYSLVR